MRAVAVESKSLEIHFQEEACAKQLLALEQQASIAETVRRAYDGRYLFILEDPADKCRKENQEEVFAREEGIRRRVRVAYFSVGDLMLRKKLIAKCRECEALRTRWVRQEVYDADTRLKSLDTSIRQWWLWAALCGAGLIGVGYSSFGIPGAIVGALAGLFLGRAIESADKSRREIELKEAESDLADSKSHLNEVRSETPTFSQGEERSGKPDPI